ncbi:MAG: zinc-binding dehydrogenase [Lentisphaerae bacterium]|nr:zinc-binding dehydrogenase [Lentisphaerota bacterium]
MKGAQVGILGCGPIGLSALKCARLFGVADIYALDPLAYRAQAARAAGADWTGDPAGPDPVGEIKARAPDGLDVVFECCGQQAAVDQALELLRPGGRLMLIGIPETDRISLIIEKARRAEIRVLNVRRQCECTADTLALMARGLLDADFMVTHRVPPAGAGEAFEMVAGYNDGVIKAMIQFDD